VSRPATRHHYVPRAYLEGFGIPDLVLVRRRDKPKPFPSNPINVAVKIGFYDVDNPDGTTSDEVEKWLADIDGDAIKVMRSIVADGTPPATGSAERQLLANYLAIQLTRTPDARERFLFPFRVIGYAAGREIDADLVREYLETVYLGFAPGANEVDTALTLATVAARQSRSLSRAEVIGSTMTGIQRIAEVIIRKHWCLEIAREPGFLTSDSPLPLWRKPTFQNQRSGIGVANAEEIRFPLGVAHQLVLTERPRDSVLRVEPDRVRRCNADMAAGCYQCVVGHPEHPKWIETTNLAPRGSVLRMETVAVVKRLPDGTEAPGEAVHIWVERPSA
jgi:Protein of unknown function (DUF4238)